MECKFVVGQRVVCNCESWRETFGRKVPVKGKIYTISKLNYLSGSQVFDGYDGIYLQFEEIVNPTKIGTSFWHDDFKPIDESRLEQFKKFTTKIPDEIVKEVRKEMMDDCLERAMSHAV